MSLDKEVNEYTSKTTRSRALHEEALKINPKHAETTDLLKKAREAKQ